MPSADHLRRPHPACIPSDPRIWWGLECPWTRESNHCRPKDLGGYVGGERLERCSEQVTLEARAHVER